MSDIVEKTIASIPSLISGTLSGKSTTASRTYQIFVKNLGNLKSRYEEEQFVKRELALQKQRLGQPGMSSSHVREYLVRLVYCSMLGYDVSFAYIHAIKLAQQGSLIDKRAGYLVSAIFLKDSDELVMLLVNTIQKDLRTTNVACISMALMAASQLISQEMIPALLPLVEEKLKHPREFVRKKALLCMLAFYGKAGDLLAHAHHHVRLALCDSDPGVMWAALHYYHKLIKADPSQYTDLVPTFVGLLDQVLNRRLPSDFEYHSIPAPWLQILLLKILAKLGQSNQSSSQLMYPLLKDVLQRTEPSHKIGLAVIYECLETVLTIWPHPAMVEHAAKVVGKFLSSKNNNLRYLGIKALTMVVRINPEYALEHQEAVMDSLEHVDLTIRTRTLDLLYQMANPSNLHVISERLLHHLSVAAEAGTRADIVGKVLQLAERFAANRRRWVLETINQALLLGGEGAAPPGVGEKVLAVLPSGADVDNESVELKHFAVKTYWVLLHQDGVPDVLLRVATWVLGEFHGSVSHLDPSQVVKQLMVVYLRPTTSDECRSWVLSALLKLSCHVSIPPAGLRKLTASLTARQTMLKQRLLELERINTLRCDVEILKTLKTVLQGDSNTKHDWSLSFLDDFVAESLETGALPYRPACIRLPTAKAKQKERNSPMVGLNFTPYESPQVRGAVPVAGVLLPPAAASSLYGGERRNSSPTTSDGAARYAESSSSKLQMAGVKRVWTKDGLSAQESKPQQAAPPRVSESFNSAELPSTRKEVEDATESTTGSLADEVGRRRRHLAKQLFSGVSSSASNLFTSGDDSQDASSGRGEPSQFPGTASDLSLPSAEESTSTQPEKPAGRPQPVENSVVSVSRPFTLPQEAPTGDQYLNRAQKHLKLADSQSSDSSSNNGSSSSTVVQPCADRLRGGVGGEGRVVVGRGAVGGYSLETSSVDFSEGRGGRFVRGADASGGGGGGGPPTTCPRSHGLSMYDDDVNGADFVHVAAARGARTSEEELLSPSGASSFSQAGEEAQTPDGAARSLLADVVCSPDDPKLFGQDGGFIRVDYPPERRAESPTSGQDAPLSMYTHGDEAPPLYRTRRDSSRDSPPEEQHQQQQAGGNDDDELSVDSLERERLDMLDDVDPADLNNAHPAGFPLFPPDEAPTTTGGDGAGSCLPRQVEGQALAPPGGVSENHQ